MSHLQLFSGHDQPRKQLTNPPQVPQQRRQSILSNTLNNKCVVIALCNLREMCVSFMCLLRGLGQKLIFTGGHISLADAFKGPNVI